MGGAVNNGPPLPPFPRPIQPVPRPIPSVAEPRPVPQWVREANAPRAPRPPVDLGDGVSIETATPLDVMLSAMRVALRKGQLEVAAEYAKDAAPYTHPKLAATAVRIQEVGGSRETIDRPPTLSREEWIAERQRALAVPVTESKLRKSG